MKVVLFSVELSFPIVREENRNVPLYPKETQFTCDVLLRLKYDKTF